MAVRARKQEDESAAAPVERLVLPLPWSPVEAGDGHSPAASRPRELLEELDRRLNSESLTKGGRASLPVVEKWSARQSMLFMLGSSALLWAGIVIAIRAIF